MGAALAGEIAAWRYGTQLVSRRNRNIAVTGALVAGGVWNIGNAERRRDELLGTVDANGGGTMDMRNDLRDEIEGWHDRWRGIGTGMAVGGGVLAAQAQRAHREAHLELQPGRPGGPSVDRRALRPAG